MKKFVKKNKTILTTFLGLYLVATGLSWSLFSFVLASPASDSSSGLDDFRSRIAELPKTEECPINGKLYSVPEREIWEERRPIAAIIENSAESRPLEGLHKADVVYEAVAEGGVTRHLAIYYCGAAAEDVRIAPVRSARIYFLNWAAEYGNNPLFVHVGGANNFCADCPGGVKFRGRVDPRVRAIEELVDIGWRYPGGNDFDTTYDSGFPVFFRDPERLGEAIATEHTMVSTTDAIYEQAEKRGFEYMDSDGVAWEENYNSWLFRDEEPSPTAQYQSIAFGFWSDKSLYDVEWKYDSSSNSYIRHNGGEAQKDLQTDTQISSKNVVIQFLDEYPSVDEEKHTFYDTISEGEAIIFNDGKVTEGSWEKDSQTDRTIFYDSEGEEIEFVRGEIWVEGVPDGNDIEY